MGGGTEVALNRGGYYRQGERFHLSALGYGPLVEGLWAGESGSSSDGSVAGE